MNTGFTERSPEASEPSLLPPSDRDQHLDRSNLVDPHRQQYSQHLRTASQPGYGSHISSHQQFAPGPSSSMYQLHQSRAAGHAGQHYLAPSQPAPLQQHSAQFHATHHQQQGHPSAADHQLHRGANQGFSVPRSITTPTWSSTSNHAPVPLHITPSAAAGVPAPLSSSSSGSMMSYWEQGAASDSEAAMNSMAPSDGHHAMGEHGRYPSSATSLPGVSPTGVAGSSYGSHGYTPTMGEGHYRPTGSVSMGSNMSAPPQHGFHPTPAVQGYSASLQPPLSSPGFLYSPSSSTTPSLPYDPSYSSIAHSQYVSYLPPADSRFYPLNPFEIKHRRRTTKTQFRVLESTFREIPKPNAALRKQISAQLDMPVRAVQIWFQNRRAKAKALDKKRPASSAGGQGKEERQRGGGYSGEGGRSMDLPPLRIDARQQENYTSASGSGVTLPSLNPGASTLRERRGLTLSSPIPPTGTASALGYAQEYNANEHGVVPRSALPLPPEHSLSGAGLPPSNAARSPYAPNTTRSFGDR